MELTNENYYKTKMLSVSTVKNFARNPQRALADYNGETPWFSKSVDLPLGTAMHDMLEKAMRFVTDGQKLKEAFKSDSNSWQTGFINLAAEQAINEVVDEIETKDEYELLRTKKGALIAKAKQVPNYFKFIWNSPIMQMAILKAMVGVNNERYEAVLEAPLVGLYTDGEVKIKFKGKPDMFIVDHQNKVIEAFDYKTSKPFDSSGFEWGEDIHGNRGYMPVEWEANKLFPWQAGVYRELLKQNGYRDYQVEYRYLVITKEKVPRFNIFRISDESMDLGYREFCDELVKAYGYINGDLEAPLVQDGSQYANEQSHQHPVEFLSEPYVLEK